MGTTSRLGKRNCKRGNVVQPRLHPLLIVPSLHWLSCAPAVFPLDPSNWQQPVSPRHSRGTISINAQTAAHGIDGASQEGHSPSEEVAVASHNKMPDKEREKAHKDPWQSSNGNLHTSQQRSVRLALLSMLLLILQGTSLSILLRYSRVKAGPPYLASVSVLFTETTKLILCTCVHLWGVRQTALEDREPVGKECRRALREVLAQGLPMLLPAGMFVMQQVLLIIAATHLDAVAFQIFSQAFKLVPTALFAYWLLGQHLEPVQWASIPVLAAGVVLVTLNPSAAPSKVADNWQGLGFVVGMVTCSISGLSSAYAGVYFEKYVKGRHAASLWVRNIQLGSFGVPLSATYMLAKDGYQIWEAGMLQGFDIWAWSVVALQVFGGLVTGMVVKYTSNVLKNFALAISVILTVLVCIPLFGQWPSKFFLVGVSLVLLSVFMYGQAVSFEGPKRLWQWCRKNLLPCVGEDGTTNRHLLYMFIGSCLAVGALVSMYGLQRYVAWNRALQLQRQAQRSVKAGAAAAKQAAQAAKGAKAAGMRGIGTLLPKVNGRVKGKG